jgi:hypothetical protein
MAGMIGQPYLDPAQLASVTAIRSAITRLRMLDFIGPGTRQDMRWTPCRVDEFPSASAAAFACDAWRQSP